MELKDLSPEDKAKLAAEMERESMITSMANGWIQAAANGQGVQMQTQITLTDQEVRFLVDPTCWAEPYMMLRTMSQREFEMLTTLFFTIYQRMRDLKPLPSDLTPPPIGPTELQSDEVAIPAEVASRIGEMMASGQMKMEGGLTVEPAKKDQPEESAMDLTAHQEDRG